MKLSIPSNPKRIYYLNDTPHSKERFTIDSTRRGERCLWKSRTTLKKMKETKAYLESVWGK